MHGQDYRLGTENSNLPGFVVMQNANGPKGGPPNWGAGFLPGAYQGTTFRSGSAPILNLRRPEGVTLRHPGVAARDARLRHAAHAD